jgi:hypothetical protein
VPKSDPAVIAKLAIDGIQAGDAGIIANEVSKRVLAAPKRDGWIETRRSGSHRVLAKGDHQRNEEAGNWHYRVLAVHINGGGTAIREEAERGR